MIKEAMIDIICKLASAKGLSRKVLSPKKINSFVKACKTEAADANISEAKVMDLLTKIKYVRTLIKMRGKI